MNIFLGKKKIQGAKGQGNTRKHQVTLPPPKVVKDQPPADEPEAVEQKPPEKPTRAQQAKPVQKFKAEPRKDAPKLVFRLPPVFVLFQDKFLTIVTLLCASFVIIVLVSLSQLEFERVGNAVIFVLNQWWLVLGFAVATIVDIRYWRTQQIVFDLQRALVTRVGKDPGLFGRITGQEDIRDVPLSMIAEVEVDSNFVSSPLGIGYLRFIPPTTQTRNQPVSMMVQNPKQVREIFYMWSLDGVANEELLNEYRKNQKNRGLLVIVLTVLWWLVTIIPKLLRSNKTSKNNKSKAQTSGQGSGQDFSEFAKPYEPDKLVQVIRKSLRRPDGICHCGLKSCAEILSGGIARDLTPALILVFHGKVLNTLYFCSINHLAQALDAIESGGSWRQTVRPLKGLPKSPEFQVHI